MIVASINTGTATLSLDQFLTPDGRIPDVAKVVEEELTAAGVDGRRFRDLSRRYQPFTVQTIETSTSYVSAVTRCREYDKMQGKNVSMSVTIGGNAYSYQKVHCMSATPVAVPGSVAGSATPSNAAHIQATLTFVLMDVISGANP